MNGAALVHDLRLARPEALYLLAVPVVVLGWSILSLRDGRKIFGPVMRAIALTLFIAALAQPERVIRIEGATRPAVIDMSASITPAMRAWDGDLLTSRLKLRSSDPAIMFASDLTPVSVSDAIAALKAPSGCASCNPGATNLETALNALAANPDARGGPAVVLTDGWQNRGDAGRAIAPLLAAGIRLYVFTPPGAEGVPNVAMTELSLPSALSKAAPFALGVTLENYNRAPVTGEIQLYRNGTFLDRRKVTLKPGAERFDFPVRSESAGLDSYRALFKADNPKTNVYAEDDSLQGWVGVGAQRKVLILTDSSRDAGYLETVVRRMGFQPTTSVVANGE